VSERTFRSGAKQALFFIRRFIVNKLSEIKLNSLCYIDEKTLTKLSHFHIVGPKIVKV